MKASIYRVAAGVGPGRGGRFGHRGFGVAILGLLLVAAVIVLAILLYRSRQHPVMTDPPLPPLPFMTPQASAAANAEAILNERLARGEVSVEDFAAARSALRGETPASPAGPAAT